MRTAIVWAIVACFLTLAVHDFATKDYRTGLASGLLGAVNLLLL